MKVSKESQESDDTSSEEEEEDNKKNMRVYLIWMAESMKRPNEG